MKKTIAIILAIVLALTLASCGGRKKANVPDTNGDGKLTCTLEIRCDTLLNHLDEMKAGKAALVPENGQLLAETKVEFNAGDSVFDVFRQILREEKIHFEYTDTQIYNSVYIEGIGNLYEFDCGPQSGWMYSVNGVSPSVSASAYTLKSGDVLVWYYVTDPKTE